MTFAEEELTALLACLSCIASNPLTAGCDLCMMQELTQDVKAETRAVLQHYGITQFKIRPVRRNYAFEQPGVQHTMQWVLKVTYPASMPQLPLGLSGCPLRLHFT